MGVEVTLRAYEPATDDPYIFSTWTRYAWYSPKEPIHASKTKWFAEKTKEIREILQNSSVRIACFKDAPFLIAGYSVIKDGDLKWICIKKDYRNQGIERLLTQEIKK